MSALRTVLITDVPGTAPHVAAWNQLALEASRPFCGADWLLAWWQHARPAGAELCVVLVHDGDDLVGVGPWFTARDRLGGTSCRPLAQKACQHVEPFAAPGREQEVAIAMAAALATHPRRPSSFVLDGVPATSPWVRLIADSWPGGGRSSSTTLGLTTALTVDLRDTDFDGWFATKSRHFRKRMRRQQREVAERGGVWRLGDRDSTAGDIDAFLRLHAARWDPRGGSDAVTAGIAEMLRAVGPAMVADGRLRIWSLDVDGTIAASGLVLRAGDEIGYWLSGFDDAYADLEPSKLMMLHVVEDAFGCGGTRLDLGEGTLPYKARFSDAAEDLLRIVIVPPTRGRLRARAALAPAQARRAVATRLSDEQKERLRGLRGRRTA